MFEKSKVDAKELTQIFNDVTANVTNTCMLTQNSAINIRSLGSTSFNNCNIINDSTSQSICQSTNNITSNIQNQVTSQIKAMLNKKKAGISLTVGDKETLDSEIDTQVKNIITDSIYNSCVNHNNNVINILTGQNFTCNDSTFENISDTVNDCLYNNDLTQSAINNLADTINDTMDLKEEGPLLSILDDILSLGALGVILILILVFAFVFILSVVLLTIGGVSIFVLPKILES